MYGPTGLLPQNQNVPATSPLMDLFNNNPTAIMNLASGLLSPDRDRYGRVIPGSGFARGAAGFQKGYAKDQGRNALGNLASSIDIPPALAEAGKYYPELIEDFIKNEYGGGEIPTMGLREVFYLDKEGKVRAAQMSDAGGAFDVNTGEKITEGQFLTPEDVARMRATGKLNAEGAEKAAGGIEKGEVAIDTVDSILTDPYFDTMFGRKRHYSIAGLERKTLGTGALAGPDSKIKQLEGQAFIKAFNDIKGGGHITEIEGIKATQAIQRVNKDLEPEDAREALLEFREVTLRGMARHKRFLATGIKTATDGEDLSEWMPDIPLPPQLSAPQQVPGEQGGTVPELGGGLTWDPATQSWK